MSAEFNCKEKEHFPVTLNSNIKTPFDSIPYKRLNKTKAIEVESMLCHVVSEREHSEPSGLFSFINIFP